MERLGGWLNWLFEDDNWRLLLIPPFLVIVWALIFYHEFTDDNPLRNRKVRTEIFYNLLAEMEGMELPPNSAITNTDSNHQAPTVRITRRYRSEANRTDFVDSIHRSLINRGWIAYPGEAGRTAIITYRYCRPGEFADLYLIRKAVFDSDTADAWDLTFSAGYGPGKTLFGDDPVPPECRKY